jgi:23S rRNA pseudouridine2605 synthase
MAFKRAPTGRDSAPGRSSNRANKSDDRPKRPASKGKSSGSDKTDWNKPPKKESASERPGERRRTAGSRPGAGKSEGGDFKSSFTGGEKKAYAPRKPYSGRPSDGGDDRKSPGRSKPYSGRVSSADSSSDRPKRSFGGDEGGEKKSYSAPRNKSYSGRAGSSDDRPKRSFGGDATGDKKPFSSPRKKSYSGRPTGDSEGGERKTSTEGVRSGERKFAPKSSAAGAFKKREGVTSEPFRKSAKSSYNKITPDRDAPAKTMRARKEKPKDDSGLIRLNRYIANAGICSRRKADELIEAGVVSVNNVVINELGHKVDPMKDEIRYNGSLLRREKMVYVLLNKPKDYITTTEDPQERRTVMHLVEKASKERIYPIGRLDRNTTGLLLMTNDGDLADKLSHPRSNITKLYQVELNKSLVQGDMNKIQYGLELEDGVIKPDSISYVAGGSKREIGIQIHSGKNRIVRRIFEHLGYEVVKLDRVIYAGLTKKDLTRGRWRYLDEKEIIQLKHLIQ